MKRWDLFALGLLAAAPLAVFAAGRTSDLPPRYRQWLDEEVVYLIGPKEKEVFLSLSADRERELFIETFWKQRDPSPETDRNEFREEHYRRIAYANQHFGRGGTKAGWATDRGRIHIILGPPRQDIVYDRQAEVVPVEVWFYQGMAGLGLPDAFSCVFYKPDPASDYEIYSPIEDGPARLLRTGALDPADFSTAYARLKKAEPEVAQVSMSLIADEAGDARSPSLASQVLLDSISRLPQATVKEDYAVQFRRTKDIVEVEHSARFIENRAVVAVIPDPSGISYVHYAIEPLRLSVEAGEGGLTTTWDLTGRVTAVQGPTVFQFERRTPVTLTRDQADTLRSRPISLQGLFPLAEGEFDLTLILKNRISQEFTTLQKRLVVPGRSGGESKASLLLAYGSRNEPGRRDKRAFLVDGRQLFVSTLSEFRAEEPLTAALVLSHPDVNKAAARSVRFDLLDASDRTRASQTVTLFGKVDSSVVPTTFDLKGLPAGDFRVRASVFDEGDRLLYLAFAPFGLTSVPFVPRPLVFTDPMPDAGDPLTAYVLAGQYFNLDDLGRAEALSGEAYRRDPSSARYALGYARVLFARNRFREIRDMLEPFIAHGGAEAAALEFMAEACRALAEYSKAIPVYREYLERFGIKISVLNGLGECLLQTGDRKAALTVWEKSLELDPDQDEIRKAAAEIKK